MPEQSFSFYHPDFEKTDEVPEPVDSETRAWLYDSIHGMFESRRSGVSSIRFKVPRTSTIGSIVFFNEPVISDDGEHEELASVSFQELSEESEPELLAYTYHFINTRGEGGLVKTYHPVNDFVKLDGSIEDSVREKVNTLLQDEGIDLHDEEAAIMAEDFFTDLAAEETDDHITERRRAHYQELGVGFNVVSEDEAQWLLAVLEYSGLSSDTST